LPLAAELNKQGKRSIVVLPKSNLRQESLFSQSGWQVVVVDRSLPETRMKAYLLSDGSGGIDYLDSPETVLVDEENIDLVYAYLRYLGYLTKTASTSMTSEIVPAIAKLWYTNGLGRLDVFPPWYAVQSLLDLIGTSRKVKHASECGLAYVMPLRKSARTKSLSRGASQIASGGGPFVMIDSPDLVERFLHRLGYLDSDMNRDLDEALLVFSRMSINRLRLSSVGVYETDGPPGVGEVKAAILSEAGMGKWQLPPQDANAIEHLVAKRMLPSADVSKDEVYEALARYCADNGLPARKTYNGCLELFLSRVVNADDS